MCSPRCFSSGVDEKLGESSGIGLDRSSLAEETLVSRSPCSAGGSNPSPLSETVIVCSASIWYFVFPWTAVLFAVRLVVFGEEVWSSGFSGSASLF